TILTVDVKADFLSLDFSEQVLLRAALVRNFTQIKRVHYVKMTVNNEELLDSKGIPVGLMKKDDFVENSGKEINSYVYSVLRFFYPSVEKDRLIYQEKKVYYSSNVPIERVVLEQVLKQSSDSHIINLIPGDTQIINVTVADNICYINLSKEFLKIENEEDARLALYSIVNSISINCFVDYVQFSVEGDANVSLADKISLRQLFQVNEKLNEGGGDNE
ncbi:MAG TPA: GerMN domain-containing protein, partial [Lachnospiraceae bacterium]